MIQRYFLWCLYDRWLILVCKRDKLYNLRAFSFLIFKLFRDIFAIPQKPFRNSLNFTLNRIHRASLFYFPTHNRFLLLNNFQTFIDIYMELRKIWMLDVMILSGVFFVLNSLYQVTPLLNYRLLSGNERHLWHSWWVIIIVVDRSAAPVDFIWWAYLLFESLLSWF